MARTYNLSDPTDLAILKSDFDYISADEWQKMIDFSLEEENKKLLDYNERGALMEARKKRAYNNYPSATKMDVAMRAAEKVEEAMKKAQKNKDEDEK